MYLVYLFVILNTASLFSKNFQEFEKVKKIKHLNNKIYILNNKKKITIFEDCNFSKKNELDFDRIVTDIHEYKNNYVIVSPYTDEIYNQEDSNRITITITDKKNLKIKRRFNLLDVYKVRNTFVSKNKLFLIYGDSLNIKSISLDKQNDTQSLLYPLTQPQVFNFVEDFDTKKIYIPSSLPGKIVEISKKSLEILKEIKINNPLYFLKKLSNENFILGSITEGITIYNKKTKKQQTIYHTKDNLVYPHITKSHIFIPTENNILVYTLKDLTLKALQLSYSDKEIFNLKKKNLKIIDTFSRKKIDYLLLSDKNYSFLSKMSFKIK